MLLTLAKGGSSLILGREPSTEPRLFWKGYPVPFPLSITPEQSQRTSRRTPLITVFTVFLREIHSGKQVYLTLWHVLLLVRTRRVMESTVESTNEAEIALGLGAEIALGLEKE